MEMGLQLKNTTKTLRDVCCIDILACFSKTCEPALRALNLLAYFSSSFV